MYTISDAILSQAVDFTSNDTPQLLHRQSLGLLTPAKGLRYFYYELSQPFGPSQT